VDALVSATPIPECVEGAQNSNLYISRTGIEMRLGQYAVPRQGANAGGGVAGDSTPGLLFGDWSAWDR
jgi:hypothetical protein